MNSILNYNTLSLLNSQYDAIHIVYHNCFRLLRPIRRKYKLSVNECIILNGIYLYHKVKGSMISLNALYHWISYYNKNRLVWYITSLAGKGYLIRSDIIKNIQYYKLTELGITVMNDFNNSYQDILYKWYNDHNIEV